MLGGGAAGLAGAGHHREPDHWPGRQPRVPDRRRDGLTPQDWLRRGRRSYRASRSRPAETTPCAGSIGTSGSFSRRSSSSNFRVYSVSVMSLSPIASAMRKYPRIVAVLRRHMEIRCLLANYAVPADQTDDSIAGASAAAFAAGCVGVAESQLAFLGRIGHAEQLEARGACHRDHRPRRLVGEELPCFCLQFQDFRAGRAIRCGRCRR